MTWEGRKLVPPPPKKSVPRQIFFSKNFRSEPQFFASTTKVVKSEKVEKKKKKISFYGRWRSGFSKTARPILTLSEKLRGKVQDSLSNILIFFKLDEPFSRNRAKIFFSGSRKLKMIF